jgi:hypothetical protein
MKLEVFKEVIKLLKEQTKKDHSVYKLGLDLMEFNSSFETIISYLLGSIYGKEGKETFDWWCYDKEWGTKKDFHMYDANNNIICETVEELHQYLEDHIVLDYELPTKYTDKERLEIFKKIFK